MKTQITAKVICDSITDNIDAAGDPKFRLTTMEMTYPLFIHNELMTHRVFSRNAASSRAIPIKKMIERTLEDTAQPVTWRANGRGMQPAGDLDAERAAQAENTWQMAAVDAAAWAHRMEEIGVHKEITNRLLAPFLWMTTIVTATDWGNFFWLRCHSEAQKEFQVLAQAACKAYYESQPEEVVRGGWHIPYIRPQDVEEAKQRASERVIGGPAQEGYLNLLVKVAVGRCARVSYLTHDGVRDLDQDVSLCERLSESGHWSPFEHVAQAYGRVDPYWCGNFRGWSQYRKWWGGENRKNLLRSPEEYAGRT